MFLDQNGAGCNSGKGTKKPNHGSTKPADRANSSTQLNLTSNNPPCRPKSFTVQDDEPPLIPVNQQTVYHENGGADFTVTRVTVQNIATEELFPVHYASVKSGHTGAVCVAHLDGNQRLLLARHWRVTTRSWAWEFPRGMGEHGEDPVMTAMREFSEETGMATKPDSGIVLQYMHADTGVLKDSIAVVSLAVDASADSLGSDTDGHHEHDWELSNMRWVSADNITAMIAQGAINDGITLAAYAVWKAHEGKE